MNHAKILFESLMTLHYKLCRASNNELKGIGEQIKENLLYVEKYKLFPVELSEHFWAQLALMCEGGSTELKLDISKELYLYLGKMTFSFEESTIINMRPYTRLLELNRTEYPYEQANDWGREYAEISYYNKEILFFALNRNHISLTSKEEYQTYSNELRKDPIDINACFPEECELPSALCEEVEKRLNDNYKKYCDYIDEHYPRIKKAFPAYHKDVRVYITSRSEKTYIMMLNMYEGLNSSISVYPNVVDIMYRFLNVEPMTERMTNSVLTGFENSDYSSISNIFCISGIHHDLNRLFVRYGSNEVLTDYLVYMLRGQLKRVTIINENILKVDDEKYLLMLSKIPPIKELTSLIDKEEETFKYVVFRSRPDDEIIEMLKSKGISYMDVLCIGQSLINNENGEMVHWFIKDRLDKIELDDSYMELPLGDILIKQLEKCPKGKEGWKQYENVGGEIFRYLFESTFRNYTYEYQSSTSDGTQRRDLVVNNTYKDINGFWPLVKNDYNANLIIVDFKNYREELNSDSFYNPTKYLNSVAGNFVIVFSRCGLDDTAKKVQHRLLSEKKLVLCLTDSDLINMINQKMNGQEPLNSLENMYYTLCKKQ